MKAKKHQVELPDGLKAIAVRSFVTRIAVTLLYYALMTYYLILRLGATSLFHFDVYSVSRLLLFLIILYIPPLFFLKIIWILSDRDFEGKVIDIKYEIKLKPSAGLNASSATSIASQFKIAVIAKVHLASGKEKWFEIRRYETDDPCVKNLRIGSYVRHYKGLKYTQILDDFRHDVDCIFCGMYNSKKDNYCQKCGRLLIKDNRVYDKPSPEALNN